MFPDLLLLRIAFVVEAALLCVCECVRVCVDVCVFAISAAQCTGFMQHGL